MKSTVHSINASQSFIFRAKCKFCRTGPKYVYYLLNKVVTDKTLYKIKDFYDSSLSSMRADDFYVGYSIKNRSFIPSYMFDPTSASMRKLPVPNMRYQQNDDRFCTVVECACGETSWSFVQSTRKHITNRKCRHNANLKKIASLYKVMI